MNKHLLFTGIAMSIRTDITYKTIVQISKLGIYFV